jgi:hypothetical protein
LREGHLEAAVVKKTTFLRTLYGHVVTPSELATRVDEHAAWAQEQLGHLESTLAATDEPLRGSSFMGYRPHYPERAAGGVAMGVGEQTDTNAGQVFAPLLGREGLVELRRQRLAAVPVRPVVRSVRASARPAQAVSSGLERTSVRSAGPMRPAPQTRFRMNSRDGPGRSRTSARGFEVRRSVR